MSLHKIKKYNPNVDKVFYDSPLRFDIEEVLNCLINLKNETVNSKAVDRYMIAGEEGDSVDSATTTGSGLYLSYEDKLNKYFEKQYSFRACKPSNVTKGTYADGTLDKFVSRFISKYRQDRLKFLFSKELKNISFEDTIKQFIGYKK